MKPAKQGFTLVELVTTATIFAILGAMLFSMVRSGMDMWSRGEMQREELERSTIVLETIGRELRSAFTENDAVAGSSDVRFLSDFVDLDSDGDGFKETRLQRLLFVRINSEERENLELRTAGDLPLGQRYFMLAPVDEDEILDPDDLEAGMGLHRPTGGLAEVAFMAFPPMAKGRIITGRPLNFCRGYRTPIGGEKSFFIPGELDTVKGAASHLVPVMGGVLHLEFRYCGQDSVSFDTQSAPGGKEGGAGYVWDSTRGLHPIEALDGPNSFVLARGPGSLDDPADDVFPSLVQATVVIAAGGRREPLARLRLALKSVDRRIFVDAVRPFEDWRFGEQLVRIGSEWIRFSRVESGELIVAERGVRNTIPSDHKRGTPVFAGRTFSALIAVPAQKEYWDEGN